MVIYAALSNTLLITSRPFRSLVPLSVIDFPSHWLVLISILSNTFARIDQVGLFYPSTLPWLIDRFTACNARIPIPICDLHNRGVC